jgi:predicted ABC-type sugar transport system permease subunit
VGEFWGQRWNIITSAWHRAFIFWPLARRRCAGVGVFCCFLVSGALHAWPMLVALGPVAALRTVVFFVLQGVAVLAESRLRIHTWPVALARVWTLVILLASSPLYIDPVLRLFGF